MVQSADRCPPRSRVAVCCLLSVLLAGCGADGAGSPTSVASRTASSPGDVTVLEVGGKDMRALQPGRYGLTANGSHGQPLAVVNLPPGMSSVGGFAVGVYGDGDAGYHALSYWTVAGVYADPCGKKGGLLPPGDTVADLVATLAAQRLTRTTRPRPITIDGHDGLQFDLVATDGVAFDKCAEGYFDVWDSSPGGGRYLQSPGQLLRLRVLDVEGSLVVLETTAVPEPMRSAWRTWTGSRNRSPSNSRGTTKKAGEPPLRAAPT